MFLRTYDVWKAIFCTDHKEQCSAQGSRHVAHAATWYFLRESRTYVSENFWGCHGNMARAEVPRACPSCSRVLGESSLSILPCRWFSSSICNPGSTLAHYLLRKAPATLPSAILGSQGTSNYPSILCTKCRPRPCRRGWSTTQTCLLMEAMSKLYRFFLVQNCTTLNRQLAQGECVRMGRHLKSREEVYIHDV